MNRNKILWILAIAFYGFGDTVTTLINLRTDCVELNPLINEYSIVPLKIAIIAALFLIYQRERSAVIPALLVVFGFIGVLSNVLVLIPF